MYSSTSKNSMSSLNGILRDIFDAAFCRSHLCGFDFNLTYPQHGHFPTLNPQEPTAFGSDQRSLKKTLVKEALKADNHMARASIKARSLEPGSERFQKREQWKRDLTGRANGTIDPWYGCDLYDEMIDYALNFSLPWSRPAIFRSA